ncbi:hypothetical protein GEV33_002693 [Tenebrio molitor]|uniref:Uncharacterized protein n=1 Tax=Tenebrio molitor TaxID=7067 RepID=A0A8J6HSY6_TENMO|nr:hypothetical protein GEV33_002693 [Tenebrio molitor]
MAHLSLIYYRFPIGIIPGELSGSVPQKRKPHKRHPDSSSNMHGPRSELEVLNKPPPGGHCTAAPPREEDNQAPLPVPPSQKKPSSESRRRLLIKNGSV